MSAPAKWGNEFMVNTIVTHDQQSPALAPLANGKFVAVWQDWSFTLGDDAAGIHGQVFNADGTRLGTEFLVNSTVGDHQGEASVAGLTDGRFVAVWNDSLIDGDVHGQIFNPDGTKLGAEFLVNTTTDLQQFDPKVAALPGGQFVVAWDDSSLGDMDIHAQRFNADGSKAGGEFQANTTNIGMQADANVVALSNDRFVIVWDDISNPSLLTDIHGQIFSSSTGARDGGELTLDSLPSHVDQEPSVAALAGGRFATAWHDGHNGKDEIDLQIFDVDGSKGASVLLGTATDSASNPVLVPLTDGSLVAAWVDTSNPSIEVHAQHFDADLSKGGPEFVVNTTAEILLDVPSIAALADGRFVIGWTDASFGAGDHSSYDIRAQIFDPRVGAANLQGTALNDDFVGTKLDDVMKGGGGDDHLDGGPGDDTMAGGIGNDTYVVDSVGDIVSEKPNEGIDTVIASIAYALPANVENLTLAMGAGAIAGIGNALDNVIIGNEFGNFLNGGDGNDTLIGLGKNDVLIGGPGDDTAVYAQALDQYVLQDEGDRIIVTGPEGTDTLTGIEHLQFADGKIEVADDGNPLFDTLYYVSRNPDVFHAGVNALQHFNASGWHEGRDPNSLFSVNGYLAANPDVKASGIDPLDHYHQTGWQEGRDPSASFDTKLYLIHNPDVAAAGVDPLAHYLQSGMAEGRQVYEAIGQTTVTGFDAEYYLFHNPDVAAAGVDPYQHYMQSGWHEGRNPNAIFDTNGYLAHYADVAAAGVNPLLHYEQSGWHEGRDPSAHFDTLGYLALNPDVAAAQVNPLEHYLQSGIYEGRAILNDGVWH